MKNLLTVLIMALIVFSCSEKQEELEKKYVVDELVKVEAQNEEFLTKDELDYGLKAIFPRVGNNMTELLNYIVSNDEIDPKKYFLYK